MAVTATGCLVSIGSTKPDFADGPIRF